MNASALLCRDLRFGYVRDSLVVRDISFSVSPGEILGIVGPNGAGKSTLLHLVTGYLKPLAGKVRLGDEDLSKLTKSETARRIAFVPQRSSTAFSFTVMQMVLMGRHPYASHSYLETAEDESACVRAMETTGIALLANSEYDRLSGGEQQLVLLARALAQGTGILAMDEPLTFLDPQRQYHILQVLREARNAGVAILITMHDLNLAARFCDRVAILHDNRFMAEGEPNVVFSAENLRTAFKLDLQVSHDTRGRVHVEFPE